MKTQTVTSEKTTWVLDFESNGKNIHLVFPTMDGMLKKSAELKKENIATKKRKEVVEVTEKRTTFNI